jgi:hypothetical protein
VRNTECGVRSTECGSKEPGSRMRSRLFRAMDGLGCGAGSRLGQRRPAGARGGPSRLVTSPRSLRSHPDDLLPFSLPRAVCGGGPGRGAPAPRASPAETRLNSPLSPATAGERGRGRGGLAGASPMPVVEPVSSAPTPFSGSWGRVATLREGRAKGLAGERPRLDRAPSPVHNPFILEMLVIHAIHSRARAEAFMRQATGGSGARGGA